MGFMNSAGLFALICVPIIILLYVLRPKNTPYTLPSLYLWQAIANEIESASRIQKFKSSLLMFLQIATVILISLMLAGLFLKSHATADQVLLMVDCSVSMQSTDMAPTRMEYAKEEAAAYVRSLGKNAKVTLVAMKDVPEILLSDVEDQGRILSAIENLYATDGYANRELAIQTAQALLKEDTLWVYFGDMVIPGATNYLVEGTKENIGVHGLAYTLYESDGTLSALASLKNEGQDKVSVPLSLYGDDLLLDAKEIEMEGNSEAKLLFEDLPIGIKTLRVQVDQKDRLEADNTALAVVAQATVKKAVLVSASNVFLEKVMKLNSGIELYLAKPTAMDTLKGYDLYIYDSVLPEKLPTDGAIFMLNPPENTYFTVLGHAKDPEVYAAVHEVTNHIESPDIAIGLTQVYELPQWAEEVLYCEYGTMAFAGNYQGVPMVVFGFDLHNTDLPLVVAFPIMMTNVTNYLVPSSMLEATSIYSGEDMHIRIQPSTEEAMVTAPDGLQTSLDIHQADAIYKDTLLKGIYTLTQKGQKGELTEYFAVNVPARDLADAANTGANETVESPIGRQSLAGILGALAIALMLLEWFIYQWRRKIHEIRL